MERVRSRSTYQAVLKTDSLQDLQSPAENSPSFSSTPHGADSKTAAPIMQELASQGFVVIGIGHPYNASILELHDGRVADGRDQSIWATSIRSHL